MKPVHEPLHRIVGELFVKHGPKANMMNTKEEMTSFEELVKTDVSKR